MNCVFPSPNAILQAAGYFKQLKAARGSETPCMYAPSTAAQISKSAD